MRAGGGLFGDFYDFLPRDLLMQVRAVGREEYGRAYRVEKYGLEGHFRLDLRPAGSEREGGPRR